MKVFLKPEAPKVNGIVDLIPFISLKVDRIINKLEDKLKRYIPEFLYDKIISLINKVIKLFYGSFKEEIRIDKSDLWNLDITLSKIIYPALLEYRKENKGWIFNIDLKDIPEKVLIDLKQISLYIQKQKDIELLQNVDSSINLKEIKLRLKDEINNVATINKITTTASTTATTTTPNKTSTTATTTANVSLERLIYDWVFNEMIYSFKCISKEEMFEEDPIVYARVKRGVMFFGKYYFNFWI